jgi:hypothetical protein
MSIKTEVGSAGEQPARDKIDVRRKMSVRWVKISFLSPSIFLREPYAFKNPSINFFFRDSERPL